MTETTKDYKVKNGEGKYLTFDFDARTYGMNPMWCAPSMAYSFSEEEAKRLACVHTAVIVTPLEFKEDYSKFMEECKVRSDGFGTHTYHGNGKRR